MKNIEGIRKGTLEKTPELEAQENALIQEMKEQFGKVERKSVDIKEIVEKLKQLLEGDAEVDQILDGIQQVQSGFDSGSAESAILEEIISRAKALGFYDEPKVKFTTGKTDIGKGPVMDPADMFSDEDRK